MSELWDALLEVDRSLPVWWRYLAAAGVGIGLYRFVHRVWRWLHGQTKPFRCGPLVWKRNEEGDVFAGVHVDEKTYPLWADGRWVADDTPTAEIKADEEKDTEED